MTKNEAVALVRNLEYVFDIVRLVDVSLTLKYGIDESGEFFPEEYKCYAVWNKTGRCENCVSAKAYAAKGRMSKYEFIGDDIYYVVAKYIVVDDTEYMLEIVSKVTDELLFGALGKENIISTIISYNNKLYKDPLTGAYNRHYYEEQLKELRKTPAVAMLDIDNFKKINDTYGHPAGDAVLKSVVGKISESIRASDQIIRYGGDEFLIIFPEMSNDNLFAKLEEIRKSVNSIVFKEHPGLTVSISIGGCFMNGSGENAVISADEMLYRAKKMKNTVCCSEGGQTIKFSNT